MYITDEAIDRFLKEDVPYMDLTTELLGIGQEPGRIKFISREPAVLSGAEEVERIFEKLGICCLESTPSGKAVVPGKALIVGEGSAARLHMAWKVCLNLLEYTSGIATRTRTMLERARRENPEIELVTTRKCFPGTKELTIKAVMAGGGLPHRLGLSETILVFKQHIEFLGGMEQLADRIPRMKRQACEKKVMVEVETLADALLMAGAGVDGIQFDKLPPEILKEHVKEVRKMSPHITLIGAGGINESNVEAYAAAGLDAIATTSVYFGRPIDMTAVIEPF